jgi:hypothetical protein
MFLNKSTPPPCPPPARGRVGEGMKGERDIFEMLEGK